MMLIFETYEVPGFLNSALFLLDRTEVFVGQTLLLFDLRTQKR